MGHRFLGALTRGPYRKFSGSRPSSRLRNRGLALPALALLAALTLGLLFLLPGGLLQAQDSAPIEYMENGEDAVVTFTATDPEGATPIAWFIAAADTDHDGSDGPLVIADAGDAEDFDIDAKTGDLTFDVGGDDDSGDMSVSPDFENPSGEGATSNTYKVVVGACDVALLESGACPASPNGQAGYHKVTVKVTNVNEPGKVTLATDTQNGTPQYLVGATLTATASDGDITNSDQDFTVTRDDEVTGVTWRWYRGETEIPGADAQANTYALVAADDGHRIRAVVYYIVTGNVDQEMADKTTAYPVLAARVGDHELKFDPAGVSRTISEGAKGRNVGAPVTATGNHGTVRYKLSAGADQDKFEIDDKTGQITTNVVLDYEGNSIASAIAAGSCAGAGDGPDRKCSLTVTANDSTGEASAPVATVTITLTNVNDKPGFSTGSQTVSVPENSTDLFGAADDDDYSVADVAGVTYTAMDPEGLTVNYSLTGPDASKFQISGTPPVLSFVSKPDFEAKASADRDNVYEVTVRASVGGDTGERMVRVTVGNVDEGPDVSGLSTKNFAENGEGAVATFTATEDPEGATPIAWFIAAADTDHDGSDGPLVIADAGDAEDFDIDAKTGDLTFDVGGDDDSGDMSVSPDFENPSGEGATSNTYKVVVGACDVALLESGACPASPNGQAGYHKVTVKVTNVNEPGKVTLATDTENGTPQYLVGATLMATASDGDITNSDQDFTVTRSDEVTGVTWRWYRGETEIPGADAQANTYALVAADDGRRIRVVVTYQVEPNTNQERASLTTAYPVLAARVGDHELKFDPAGVSRTISEGAKGRNVGAPVTATGNHGTVRYKLSAGADQDKFEIDDKTGQITTNVVLDYEGNSIASAIAAGSCAGAGDGPDRKCSLTVTANDSTGEASAPVATVTITLTNVNDKPGFSTGSQTVSVPENSTDLFGAADDDDYSVADVAGVTYTAMDPEGLTVNYSLTGPDASKFQTSGTPPVLSFVSKPDFEAKASADRDNVYEVTVRASVGGDTGERMVRVTVGNVDEPPIITSDSISVSGQASVSYAEGGTDAVGTYTAQGANSAMARWSLSGDDAGDFRLSSSSGMRTMLKFRTSPDYESPADAEGDNVYMVTVKAVQGDNMHTRDVTVRVTNEDELGMLAGESDITYMENDTDAVETYTADGPVTASWSLEGDDMGAFTIGRSSGELMFRSPPDFEAPADMGMDNMYMVTVMAKAGGEMDMMEVMVTVTDQAELGTLMGEASVDYAENGMDAVGTYTADGPVAASWSLEGDDMGAFTIGGSSGELMFAMSPNFEAPTDMGMDNMYMVTVKAEAGGEMGTMDVTVTVTDETVLGLTGDASVDYAENGMDAVATYTADGSATVTWSLEGGDADAFTIPGGMLTFKESPNYEAPADMGMDNMYQATVKAEAGGEMDMMDVTVTVTDETILGLTGEASVDYAENGMDAVATYTADGSATVTWSIEGDDADAFTIDSGGMLTFKESPNFEAPADMGMDNMYQVTVKAEAGGEMGTMDVTVTVVEEAGGDPLVARYDANNSGTIDLKSEVIAAIDDYLGDGADAPSRDDVIRLIALYLFG